MIIVISDINLCYNIVLWQTQESVNATSASKKLKN